MNQILLTGKMASKCRKKIEKKQERREARILRINNFKLILKNTVKFLLSKERISKKENMKQNKTKKAIFKPMNQILISGEKALMPIKHRENMIYKAGLVFSIICSLTFGGLSVYATYDRNKNEELSRDLLASIEAENVEQTEKQGIENKITSERISLSNDSVVVILNKEIEEPKINIEHLANAEKEEDTTKKYIEVNLAENGETYYIIAKISIPKIGINYPVLSETSDTLLKISPCKYWGGDIHSVGNLCIMGHNYVNSQFFSKVPNLKSGDIIELTDVITGETVNYSVYDKYTIADDDMSPTSQMTDGNVELTLITCTNNGKGRVVVKARAV